MTVSVIIPVFDREPRLLHAAIASAQAQTVSPSEIIVVDDGSAIDVESQLGPHRNTVQVIRQPNAGIGPARNTGVQQATGDFIAFLDSDDVWLPDKLEVQLATLHREPTVDAVFGQAEQFFDEQTDERYRSRHPIVDIVIDAWISTAMLIRTGAFQQVGPFAPQSHSVDIDWQLQARDCGLNMIMIEQVVYRRRLHAKNLGLGRDADADAALVQAVRAHLHRKRS